MGVSCVATKTVLARIISSNKTISHLEKNEFSDSYWNLISSTDCIFDLLWIAQEIGPQHLLGKYFPVFTLHSHRPYGIISVLIPIFQIPWPGENSFPWQVKFLPWRGAIMFSVNLSVRFFFSSRDANNEPLKEEPIPKTLRLKYCTYKNILTNDKNFKI